MARFAYTVQDSKGETISGSLEANDENDAIGVLQGKGYFILSISSDKSARSSLAGKAASATSASVAETDLVFFAEQLATLLNGGVPLVRALSLLGEHSSSKGLQLAVGQVTKDVASGTALYKALEKHPKAFDSLWVSLVQAGEMGGQLPKSLKQIGAYLSAQSEMKAKVVTALAYPGILFFISMGVLTFFIVKIVPVFSDIFKQFGVQLPPLTKAIILISDVLVHHLAALVFVIVGLAFVWRAYTSTESGNVTKWKLIFGIPFFGQFIMNILVERLLTTMSALIESGVSILNTITVLEGVFTNNIIFQRFLRMVRNDVASGKSISGAFKKTGVLPPLVTEMMFMGEESGKLPEMLVTLSGFYREQIEQFTRRFTAIIEPIMVVGIGIVVGTIVLAVFLPIFKMSSLGAK
ncbi:MAG: type II secretion system F family protein [Elusimicrobia bacterium]|nr:type II secretion system F family protein [Elusimicrobiota bacterium]